jgi:alcohol dehydrogenase (cytochrome c)
VRRKLFIVAVVAIVAAALLAILAPGAKRFMTRTFPYQSAFYAGLARNYIWSWSAPPGATTTEANPAYNAGAPAAAPRSAAPPANAAGDWPSYNRTLTSERFADLSEINAGNVGRLKVVCTYDTGQHVSFESGLIMVNGALIGTTFADIFSIDPATCAENWRTREDLAPELLSANRGVAYMDGMLFRGDYDGQALAYDFKTGKRLWRTAIADPARGEFVPGAPIAWNGLVFIANGGGDGKGAKGRMYALDAKTGKVVWEFFLVPKTEGDPTRGPQGASPLDLSTWLNPPGVPISGGGAWTSYTLDPATGELYVPVGNPSPVYAVDLRKGENLFTNSILVLDAKTGAYKRHYKLLPKDWHDWDVSNPPALIHTLGGKSLLSAAPKDGYLYGIDLSTSALLYRTPVTRIENADAPFSTEKEVHFCPGVGGGAEWNGPAFDPATNLVLIGETDWCTSVLLQIADTIKQATVGGPWFGAVMRAPLDLFGRYDEPGKQWGGWLYAVDADAGVWKWRLRDNYPIVSGVTPTAGGLVFFGDLGGNFYALGAATGQKLWGQKIGGAIGGGVITYTAGGAQKVAVATGLANIGVPTDVTTGKIVVLGLEP